MLKKLYHHLTLSLTHAWYQPKPNLLLYLLWPLAKLFEYLAKSRHQRFLQTPYKKKFCAPVVIVGNLTVGGNGKTPCIIGLTHFLQELGYTPGIISRGYGGHAPSYPYAITATSQVTATGDEALLLCQSLACPVVIDPHRARAAQYLLAHYPQVDIVLSDDGLQHYALARDYELVVMDGERGVGNGWCLPAGPLREPVERLHQVDMVITQVSATHGTNTAQAHFTLEPQCFVQLAAPQQQVDVHTAFPSPVHAVAAIGNPERFFATLRALGLTIIPHVYPDHYWFNSKDLDYNDQYPVIMTAKDAIKCLAFCKPNWWYLQVITQFNAHARAELCQLFGEKYE